MTEATVNNPQRSSPLPQLLPKLTIQQPAETTALLTRLASKPGVQSTLILSKVDGSIIRTSGLISQPTSSSSTSNLRDAGVAGPIPNSGSLNGAATSDMRVTDRSSGHEEGRGGGGAGMKGAEEMARMVWGFVEAAGGLVCGLDAEDEVKLLRLRTKKNELVIVPGKLSLHSMWWTVERIRSGLICAQRRRLQISACCRPRHTSSLTIGLFDSHGEFWRSIFSSDIYPLCILRRSLGLGVAAARQVLSWRNRAAMGRSSVEGLSIVNRRNLRETYY